MKISKKDAFDLSMAGVVVLVLILLMTGCTSASMKIDGATKEVAYNSFHPFSRTANIVAEWFGIAKVSSTSEQTGTADVITSAGEAFLNESIRDGL